MLRLRAGFNFFFFFFFFYCSDVVIELIRV